MKNPNGPSRETVECWQQELQDQADREFEIYKDVFRPGETDLQYAQRRAKDLKVGVDPAVPGAEKTVILHQPMIRCTATEVRMMESHLKAKLREQEYVTHRVYASYLEALVVKERLGFVKLHNSSPKPLARLKHSLTMLMLNKVKIEYVPTRP